MKTKIQRSAICYLKDLFSTTTTKTTGHTKKEEQEANGTQTQETHSRQRLSPVGPGAGFSTQKLQNSLLHVFKEMKKQQ